MLFFELPNHFCTLLGKTMPKLLVTYGNVGVEWILFEALVYTSYARDMH